MKKKIKIGTRGSLLAIAQTNLVIEMMREKFPEIQFEIEKIETKGDKDLKNNWRDKNLSTKSLFTKEIEKELLEKKIDIAVHSMKDMPIESPKGLVLAGVPRREDNRDVFISKTGKALKKLNENPIIGTSSLRRAKFIKNLRKDVIIKPIRGNIHTRLKKLEEEDYDGIILALAGIIRTNLEDRITEYFDTDEIVPAPAQGALYIQCREKDEEILKIVKKITDKDTMEIVNIEREFSKMFDGGCHTPMGCSGKILGNYIELKGMYFFNEILYMKTVVGKRDEGLKIAHRLAKKIQEAIDGEEG